MSIGFATYGVMMMAAAAQAYRHARARRLETHRAWAIRLYALTIGSWLYRMDYGFWELFTGGLGSTDDFRGPFDIAMCFLFYVPTLLLAELFIRARRAPASPALQASAAAILGAATLLVLAGTYVFTVLLWWPGILHGLGF